MSYDKSTTEIKLCHPIPASGGETMGSRRFFSLRSKVLLFAVAVAVIPLVIVSGFSTFESTKLIQSQVAQLKLESARAVSSHLDMMMNDVNTISLNLIQNRDVSAYLSSKDPAARQKQLSRILSICNEQAFNKPYLFSIYLQDLAEKGIDTRGALNAIPPDRLLRAKERKGGDSWYPDSVYVQNKEIKVITMIRDIRDINDVGRSLGVLKINIPQSSILELYRSSMPGESPFYLLDGSRIVLTSEEFHPDGGSSPPPLPPGGLGSASEGQYVAELDGESYLAVYDRMSRPDWHIVELTPLRQIAEPAAVIRRFAYASMLASLAFILIFGSKVLKPLKKIRELMRHVERENFGGQMEVKGSDEIALLSHGFNRMSRKLDELINEVHVSRMKQKDAELKALEEQINPHFLYNTLDMIYWMCRMERAFETSLMINSLSQLFRIGLNSGSRFTTVEKEVEHIRHYMAIQQKRHDGGIRFLEEIDPSVLSCKVTKIVLQPLVENAVRHGIEPGGGEGRIRLRIYRQGADLLYEVADDGAGADEQEILSRLEACESGKGNGKEGGLGLTNIRDRIRLNYGTGYGIDFRSIPGKGTVVTVRQPCTEGEAVHVQGHAG